MTKIISNILKFGVHCYLPKAKINLRSNFNSEKLVKIETRLYGFAEVGNKGGEIFWNIFLIYDQISIIRNCSKVKLRHAFSLGLALNVVKIAWNIAKSASV